MATSEMTDLWTPSRDYAPDFHTTKAKWLANQHFLGYLSWTEYLSRTVPVMVACQSQGETGACLPFVLGFAESLGDLVRDLIAVFNLQQEDATLKVKWGGSGAKPFDFQKNLLLDTTNLESALRLLKQRQGIDIILLESQESSLVGQVSPSGDQKVLKREGKKKQEGRKGAEGDTWRHQRHSSQSDVAMEEI